MTKEIRLFYGWGKLFDWSPKRKWEYLQEIMTENTNTRLILFGASEHDHVFNSFNQLCDDGGDGFMDMKPILNKLSELKSLSGNTLEWVTGANRLPSHKPVNHAERLDPDQQLSRLYSFTDNPIMFDRVHNYGTFWLTYGFNGILSVDNQTGRITSPILVKQAREPVEHLFICKNANPHYHRCAMMDALATHGLIEDNLVTFASMEHSDMNLSNDYEWHTWQPESLSIEHDLEDQWYGIPVKYAQTWLELVTESDVRSEFFTEKTVKPLLYEKPFVILGCPGINHSLQDWGFKLYDEIFDYDFDNISDYRVRAQAIAQQLADWQHILRKHPERIQKLRHRVADKARYNLINLLEIIMSDKYVDPDLKQILECLPLEHNYDAPQLINVHNNNKNGRRLANIILKTIKDRTR